MIIFLNAINSQMKGVISCYMRQGKLMDQSSDKIIEVIKVYTKEIKI